MRYPGAFCRVTDVASEGGYTVMTMRGGLECVLMAADGDDVMAVGGRDARLPKLFMTVHTTTRSAFPVLKARILPAVCSTMRCRAA